MLYTPYCDVPLTPSSQYRITCPCDATADDNIPNFSTQQCFTTTYVSFRLSNLYAIAIKPFTL